MANDLVKKIQGFLLPRLRNPRHRQWVRAAARRIIAVAGVATLVSTLIGSVVYGADLFTRVLPAAGSAIAKRLLLAAPFQDALVRHAVRSEASYAQACIGKYWILDLDDKLPASDLVVAIYGRDPTSGCDDEEGSVEPLYLVMRDSDKPGFWPTYRTIRTVSGASLGTPRATSFQSSGPFFVATMPARVNPLYLVGAYYDGELQFSEPLRANYNFGPVLIDRRLYLTTTDGIQVFNATGERFTSSRLTACEIFSQDNSVKVLEAPISSEIDPSWKCERFTTLSFQYEVPAAAPSTGEGLGLEAEAGVGAAEDDLDDCRLIFVNGQYVEMKRPSAGARCEGTFSMYPLDVLVPTTACGFEGFISREKQFPQGVVLDPAASDHTATCPESEEDGEPFVLHITRAV